MNQQMEDWNTFYESIEDTFSDPWLQNYQEYFKDTCKILDLGCGNGSNIPFLLTTGAEVTAIDSSQNAVSFVKKNWDIKTFVHDIRNQLPFPNDYFDIILTDLSLHYFSEKETRSIVSDLYRVVIKNGILIGRVNSIHDHNHGAGIGKIIEPAFFEYNGRRKRFFDREMIRSFFNDKLTLLQAKENSTNKYGKTKMLWEFISQKLT